MKQLLSRARYLALIAVAGLSVTTLITFALSIMNTIGLVGTLLNSSREADLAVVDLLEVIDTYLLAIVQLIVVIGLYELFIGPLDIPAWLKARSLDDLKKSIVDVLIIYIGVKGIEQLLSIDKPLDALTFTTAVAILIIALTLFKRGSPPHDEPTNPQLPSQSSNHLPTTYESSRQ